MKDDDKGDKRIVSLAAKREEDNRDFKQERTDIVREACEIGLSDSEAKIVADEVLLTDYLLFQAAMRLGRWDDDADRPDDLVQLVGIMRQGITDRRRQ
jgi:hypothetical protein